MRQRTTIAEFEALPARLRELVGLAARLHARILHLEQIIAEADDAPRGVGAERGREPARLLERAFGPPRERCLHAGVCATDNEKAPRERGFFMRGATTPVLARITS